MPFEVISYFFEENSLFLIHVLNLFILVTLILLFIFARRTGRKWIKYNDYLGVITKTVNSIRYGDLSKKIDKMDIPSSVQLTDSLNRMIESLNDREKMITEYQNELHKQNKFLEAVFNSLSDGLIVVDEDYKILQANPTMADGKTLFSTDHGNLGTGAKPTTASYQEAMGKMMHQKGIRGIETLNIRPKFVICDPLQYADHAAMLRSLGLTTI